MYREVIKGWFKHLDFMILDAVILEFSLLITYFFKTRIWHQHYKRI